MRLRRYACSGGAQVAPVAALRKLVTILNAKLRDALAGGIPLAPAV